MGYLCGGSIQWGCMTWQLTACWCAVLCHAALWLAPCHPYAHIPQAATATNPNMFTVFMFFHLCLPFLLCHYDALPTAGDDGRSWQGTQQLPCIMLAPFVLRGHVGTCRLGFARVACVLVVTFFVWVAGHFRAAKALPRHTMPGRTPRVFPHVTHQCSGALFNFWQPAALSLWSHGTARQCSRCCGLPIHPSRSSCSLTRTHMWS